MTGVKIFGATIDGLDMVETLCCVDTYINLGKQAIKEQEEQSKLAKEAKEANEANEAKAAGGEALPKGAKANSKIVHHIVTLNAEILYNAQTDAQLLAIINKADLVTPDGSGIVWGCKELAGVELQRVTGIDLMQEICKQSQLNNWGIFLFGGKPGVADEAGKKLEERYGAKIVGMAHGYFKPEDEEAIIQRINASEAQILFIALGAPKQELWLDAHRDLLKVPVVVGVGGSFDVIAGTVKRAPEFFQKMGLEWMWRLIKEPTRYKRMLSLPKFARLVKKEARKAKRQS